MSDFKDKKDEDKDDDKEDKEEINRIIKELKENSNGFSSDELDLLTEALLNYDDNKKKSKFKVFICQLVSFVNSFLLLYIISVLGFGLCLNSISFSNRFIIFIVALIVSIILAAFESLPSIKLFDHQILNYLFLFILIIIIFYLLNNYVYKTFNSSYIWIIYLIGVESVSIIIRLYLIKKRLKL